MKSSTKITLCALTSALATAIMLMSFIPTLTYAIPAMAGFMVLMPMVEVDYKYSFATYIVTSILVMLVVAEKEAAVLYVCFFGHYPIVKALVEKIRKSVIEWILKIGIFNLCVVAAYWISTLVTEVYIEELGDFGKYSVYVLLGLANIIFVIYDIAISRAATVYIYKIHPQIKKIMK